jgi:hypothetical protein
MVASIYITSLVSIPYWSMVVVGLLPSTSWMGASPRNLKNPEFSCLMKEVVFHTICHSPRNGARDWRQQDTVGFWGRYLHQGYEQVVVSSPIGPNGAGMIDTVRLHHHYIRTFSVLESVNHGLEIAKSKVQVMLLDVATNTSPAQSPKTAL